MTHYKTISIVRIIELQQTQGWSLFSWPLFISGIAYLLILPAILGIRPFDMASAAQEISSGTHVEYGGKYLALTSIEHAFVEFISIALFVNLFLGGGNLFGVLESFINTPLGVFLGIIIFLLKMFILFTLSVFVKGVFPRLRIEQAVKYLFKWPILLSLVGLILTMVIRS